MVHRSAFCTAAHPTKKEDEKGTQPKHRKACDAEAHHHAACEGDFQSLAQACAGGLGGANVGLCGDPHANVSGKCREHGTDYKCHHDEPMGGFHHGRDEAEECACDDDEHGQNAVFRAQEGQGAFVNVLGDFAHAGFAGALLANPSGLNGHDDQSKDGQARYEVEQRLLHR